MENDLIYMTATEAAGLMRVEPQTAALWRMKGKGPPYRRLGTGRFARVLYRRVDVIDWIESSAARNTSEETPPAIGQAVSA